jgi:hypothetical protein
VVGRMQNGYTILGELAEKTLKTVDFVNYKGININRLLLKATRKYYEMGIKVYIGQEIIKRLEGIESQTSWVEIQKKLTSGGEGKGKWVEICGLFSPKSKTDEMIEYVKSGDISTLDDLNGNLRMIYTHYPEYSWNWCAELIRLHIGMDINVISAEDLIRILKDWKTNAVKLNNMVLKDAEKEFDIVSRLGFGLDGDDNTRDLDFQAVRGTYEENKFVLGLQKEIKEIEEKADALVAQLEKLL